MGACFAGFFCCENTQPFQSSSKQRWRPWVSAEEVVRLGGPAAALRRYHVDKPLAIELELQGDGLGNGQSGVVMLAINKNGKKFAVKSFEKKSISVESQEFFKREANIHFTLEHPHIVRLEQAFESREVLHLVVEYVPGGELYDRIERYGEYAEDMAASCAVQILQAVAYLHSRGIIHRDLKLENILCVDELGSQLKIIDFGLATHWDGFTPLFHICGTAQCLAPEVFGGFYTNKIDIWSVGLMWYEMLLARSAFRGEGDKRMEQVKAGNIFYGLDFAKLSAGAQSFLRYMLRIDPAKRPSASQALRHSWLHSSLEANLRLDADNVLCWDSLGPQPTRKRLDMVRKSNEFTSFKDAPLSQFHAASCA